MLGAAVSEESSADRLAHLREIDRFVRTPCNYFPYGGPPSFGRLSRDQRRYYAYFRTILDTDGDIRGDEGYYRLLVIECLSTAEGRGRLERYLSKERGTGFYNFAKDLLPELRIHRGADPGPDLGTIWDSVGLLFAQTFLPGYRGATAEQLSAILSVLGFGYIRRISSNSGLDLFGKALSIVESRFRETDGRGIGERFAGEEASIFRTAFGRYLPQEECSRHAIVYRGFDMKGIRTLLMAVADRVDAHLSSQRGMLLRSTDMDAAFYDDLVEAVSSLGGDTASSVMGSLSPVRVVTAGPDGRMPEEVPPSEPRMLMKGELVPSDGYTVIQSSDIQPGDDGMFYPRSGDTGYYRFWRNRLHEGKVYPFDTGMVLTRYREMARAVEPREAILRELMRAVRSADRIPEVLVRVIEYVSASGDLPVDRVVAKVSWKSLRHLLFRLMAGRRQPIERWLFTDCLDMEWVWTAFSDTVEWDAFRFTFTGVMRNSFRTGAVWFRLNGMDIVRIECTSVFEDEPAVGIDALSDISRALSDELYELASETHTWLAKRRQGRHRRKPIMLFGMDIVPIMERSIDAALAAETERTMSPMDKDRIRQAREDLAYVVETVGTEDEGEPEPEREVPKEVPKDPWDSLTASLSPDQIRYLKDAIEGTRTNIRIEYAINEISSECIGDAVVEDGKVFEEYAAEISRRIS